MGISICFANMKGGVGKTTLCVSLAFELFRSGSRVLVVDNDPQFNATASLLKPSYYIEDSIASRNHLTIYDIYEKTPRIRGIKTEKFDPKKFFYRTWHLTSAPDITLDLIASRIELYETLKNPSQKEYMLDKFLAKYAANYDYIFIDCPPTPSVLTLSAFAASNYIMIPVTPDYYATIGLPQFLGTVKDFKDNLHDPHGVTPLGIVFTIVPRQISAEIQNSIDRVRKALDDFPMRIPVFNAKMSYFKVYQKALWRSVPVQKISGRGTGSRSLAIAEIRHLVTEMKNEIARLKGEEQ